MDNAETELFWTDWRRFHPHQWPVGWALRQSKSLPWLRLHALPESKRYSQNAAEQAIILDRAYELAGQVIGDGEHCWQVAATYGDWAPSSGNVMQLDDDVDEVARGLHFDAMARQWQRGGYDTILTEIADDVAGHILWFNSSNGAIFAPYDGGFDLFPSSQQDVENYRMLYSEWLSKRPDGL